MQNCLQESDLRAIGEESLADFDRRVAQLDKDLRAPFHQEARQLETELLTIYRFIARGARQEPDLDRVAALWGLMVEMCDDFLKRLSGLKELHPACGAEIYYDRALDLRNKCQRLQAMHS
jgi:hypothetical protein